jgi:hypothetical protein
LAHAQHAIAFAPVCRELFYRSRILDVKGQKYFAKRAATDFLRQQLDPFGVERMKLSWMTRTKFSKRCAFFGSLTARLTNLSPERDDVCLFKRNWRECHTLRLRDAVFAPQMTVGFHGERATVFVT